MTVEQCMTREIEVVEPNLSIAKAAKKMRDGDFGILPVCENGRLVGMISDRDIVTRAVADGMSVNRTKVRDVMSKGILYCFEDQAVEEVAKNMGDNQVRRMVVVNREKKLMGILSLGDIAQRKQNEIPVGEALGQISEHVHREPQRASA